jgi:Galactose oxidase, central domain
MREQNPRSRQHPLPRITSLLTKRHLRPLASFSLVLFSLTFGITNGATSQAAVPPGANTANRVSPTWHLLTPPTQPTPVSGAAMAYDRTDHTMMLWGGSDSGGAVVGTTWGFNGSTWQMLASGPDRRTSPLVFDPQIHGLLAFGGAGLPGQPGIAGDTWTFNGSAWTQIATSGPPARESAAMAYDPKLKEVLLFGGDNGSTPLLFFGDTWAWTPLGGWKELSPATSPTARFGATMSYDRSLGKLVLFGGQSSTGPVQNDTWTFDGSTWQLLDTTTSPPSRVRQAMTYDNHLHAVVVWGGTGVSGDLNDTWLLRGSQWSELNPTPNGPGPVGGVAMAYDPASRMAILVGGVLRSTGQFSDQEWGLQ